jgi:Tfp pilus assembly protein PilF
MRAAAALCAIVLLNACSSHPFQTFFERGNRAIAAHKYADAIIDFENAVRSNRQSAAAQSRLGDAYAALGQTDNAAAAHDRACALDERDVAACLQAAAERLALNEYDTAAAAARHILAADPFNLDAQLILGSALAGVRDFAGAEQRLEAALAQAPQDARVYTALGQLGAARGDRRIAQAWLQKAVEINPNSADARVALAESYLADGRGGDGEREMRAAIASNPQNLEANRLYAEYLVTTSRCTDAEPYWKTVAAQSTDGSGALALADYYVWSGRPDAALRILEPLTRTRDEGGAARTRMAAILYDRRDRAGATKLVDGVLSSDQSSVTALLLKARMALDAGDLAAGSDYAHKAATVAPDAPAVRSMLATVASTETRR